MGPVLDIVAPVFGIVLLGFALVRLRLFDEQTSAALTKFVFYVPIPAMLFRTLASVQLPAAVPWRYLAAFYLPSFVLFGAGMRLAKSMLGWNPSDQGIAGMAASYSNMALLGLPLTLAAYGEEAAFPMFVLLATQSMVLFPVATYVIETGASRTGRTTGLVAPLLKLTGNPIILSLGLGVAANLVGLPIHGPVARLLELVGAAAPGCALIALGVSLGLCRLSGSLREAGVIVVLKNLVYPLAVWGSCRAFDIPVAWERVAVLLAAMPTGVNVFIYARKYDLQVATLTKSIVLSTAVSALVASGVLRYFLP